jgi:hypothetical protein
VNVQSPCLECQDAGNRRLGGLPTSSTWILGQSLETFNYRRHKQMAHEFRSIEVVSVSHAIDVLSDFFEGVPNDISVSEILAHLVGQGRSHSMRSSELLWRWCVSVLPTTRSTTSPISAVSFGALWRRARVGNIRLHCVLSSSVSLSMPRDSSAFSIQNPPNVTSTYCSKLYAQARAVLGFHLRLHARARTAPCRS